VVGDVTHYPCFGLSKRILAEAYEFNVVILQPLRGSLAKRFSVHEVVVINKLRNPITGVRGMSRIGWVADDDREAFVAFDIVDGLSFVGERRKYANQVALAEVRCRFKGVVR